MQAQKILDNYCRLYGVTMPEIDYSGTHYFVTISSAGTQVLYLHKASKLLGQIVGEAMKRGTVLYVHNGWVAPLTWEKWRETWTKLFTPPKRDKTPEPNRTSAPKRYYIFETMQQKRPRKKPRLRGSARTDIANRSMNLLSII